MNRFDRPIYAPRAAYRAPRDHHEDEPRRQPILLAIAAVIVVAFASIVWSVYGGFSRAPVRIEAPAGSYKVAPSAAESESEDAIGGALFDALEGQTDIAEPQVRPADETPLPENSVAESAAPAAALRAPDPVFAEAGPYLAQIAALQSEESVAPLWARLASRAPELFAAAQLDVERADLGQRGIYFRVRAGYFADRDNADRFCARLRAMGQDCIAVRR